MPRNLAQWLTAWLGNVGGADRRVAFMLAMLAMVSVLGEQRACAQCAQWLPWDTFPGVNGRVDEVGKWDPDGPGPRGEVVVVAGAFTLAGQVPCRQIAMWDPATGAWSPFGNGLSNVTALAVLPSGELVAGTSFPNATGGFGAVYRWNGTEWLQMGEAVVFGGISELQVMRDGTLVAGGSFRYYNDQPMDFIMKWDGSQWTSMGSGTDGRVTSFALTASGELVVGGTFTHIGGIAANRVAKWNGVSWSALGDGLDDQVLSVAVLRNGDIVVGGLFVRAGGVSSPNVSKWNGTAWQPMPPGLGATVRGLVVRPNGDLIACGAFGAIGITPVYYIARWTGTTWVEMNGGLQSGSASAIPTTMVVLGNGDVVVGGFLNGAGGVATQYVAKWNGSSWSGLGYGNNNPVNALARHPDGRVIAGGKFTQLAGVAANHVASWDGSRWSVLGSGLNGDVGAIAIDPVGTIYAAGAFSSRVARWNGTSWVSVGTSPFNGKVDALAIEGNGNLLAAGTFSSVASPSARRVYRWNGSTWTALGSDFNELVSALAVLPSGQIVAGGRFGVAGGVNATRLAKWNGSVWEAMGSGADSDVNTLAVAPGGDLIVGGRFFLIGGVQTQGIARLSGGVWSRLGFAIVGGCNRAIVLPNGDVVAAGGFSVGTVSASAVGRWNGSAWTVLGDVGFSDAVNDVVPLDDGDFMAGGDFRFVGSVDSSFVARFTESPVAITHGPAGSVVCAGGVSELSVATPDPSPTYQWQRETAPGGFAPVADGPNASGAVIDGAATGLLRISNIGVGDAGRYRCVVSSDGCSRTSAAALLGVNAAPVVTTAPTSQSVCRGAALVLQSGAVGVPAPTFQWRKNGVEIPGATSASLAISGASSADSGEYVCVASNVCGAMSSSPAVISVCLADFDCSGSIDADDLGDFIACYFAVPACARADFNGDAETNADDLGDFVTAFFAGCP